MAASRWSATIRIPRWRPLRAFPIEANGILRERSQLTVRLKSSLLDGSSPAFCIRSLIPMIRSHPPVTGTPPIDKSCEGLPPSGGEGLVALLFARTSGSCFCIIQDMRGHAKIAGAVCSLQSHLVSCPMYRCLEREGTVRQRRMGLRREKAATIALTGHAMDVISEQAHLFIEPDPRSCGLPTLWSSRNFAAMVGRVTEPAVRHSSAHHQGT